MKSTIYEKLRLLVLSLAVSCLIGSVSPELFTHYRLQHGKRVASRHLAALQLGEAYTISSRFSGPPIDCGVACNLNPACTAYSLNSSNSCTLFNEQVSLIHLEDQADSTVYANHKMSTCIKDFYPDLVAMNCFPKKVADATCSASIECSDSKGLECADVNQDGQNDTCKCKSPDSNYWDAAAVKCLPKLTNGQSCQSAAQCLTNKGLGCTGMCTCSLPDQFFWNTTADQCTPRQSNGGPCQLVDQCLPSKGLDCLDTNADAKVDNCACPDPTNQYWDAPLNRCNCFNLAAFYWDSTTYKCFPRQSNGGPCQSVGQCLPNTGLDCLDTNADAKADSCICPDSTNQYWDAPLNLCSAKKLYGAPCSATQECRTNYFLDCVSGVCKTVSPGTNAYTTTDNISTAYRGCYADCNGRDLPFKVGNYASHDSCVKECKNKGYKFAGCQNGNECWCGNSYGSQGLASCTMKCHSNSAQTCGKACANSVFEIL